MPFPRGNVRSPDNDDQRVRDFLTRQGLYVELELPAGTTLPGSISQPCEVCKDEATTTWRRESLEGPSGRPCGCSGQSLPIEVCSRRAQNGRLLSLSSSSITTGSSTARS